jgi:sulfatase modifying factor 1
VRALKDPLFHRSVLGFALGSIVVAVGCGARSTQARSQVAGAPSETIDFAAPPQPAPQDSRAGNAAPPASVCPTGMVLVAGDYCPKVRQACLRWVDPPGPYQDFRCAEYAPSECLAAREPKRFCIDVEEYVRPDEALPLAHQSWKSAGAICGSMNKRLCLESEWQLACEGEEMRPYPYGLVRDSAACNIDRMDLGMPENGLNDLRAPVTEYPRCLSPFGVHDMSGNVEEWATLDHGIAPQRSTMKGAWWLPGKNNCRAATLGHGEAYEGPQVGVRCCMDAPP